MLLVKESTNDGSLKRSYLYVWERRDKFIGQKDLPMVLDPSVSHGEFQYLLLNTQCYVVTLRSRKDAASGILFLKMRECPPSSCSEVE
ncbi:hypothetical protein CEXT_101271 [Caerostris extrusa]|uniref:Uncharacterized protein n=1 Tax=Caerostris extrusa TaxID=172846 RepID=A0AAV4NFM2_CAEEX|nr:hypothetical protein CEXT_101271 [Caerostris extrusa]